MKVTAGNYWQTSAGSYRLFGRETLKNQETPADQTQVSGQESQTGQELSKELEALTRQDEQKELQNTKNTDKGTRNPGQDKEASSDLDQLVKSLAAQPSSGSPKSGKMKSSSSGNSVGELAAQLAQAQTKMDVQQIAGKAMRALVNLQMSAAMSEGTEKKKAQQLVARMKKLIKRINKKMQHLAKEEQMEIQIKKAEKKQEQKKAEELAKELKTHRSKRRRDERNYASKEISKDRQDALNEMTDSLAAAAGSPAPVSSGSAPAADFSAAMDAAMSLEPVSIDISV